MSSQTKPHQLYCQLLKKHGAPVKLWSQWCAKKKTPSLRELITIGAILTQRTSWHNTDLALRNLKKEHLLSLQKIASLKDLKKLIGLIRPAGFYQTKPRCLFDFCFFIVKKYKKLSHFGQEDSKIAREKLLSLKGIGPETADTILLYGLDQPTFIIDEYTKRFVKKRNLSAELSYDELKGFFEKNLPRNTRIYQNYHALIIIEQKGREGSKMEKV